MAALLGCTMLLGVGACNGAKDASGNSNADPQYSQSTDEKVTEKILLNKKSFTLFLKEETEQDAQLTPIVYEGGVQVGEVPITYVVENPAIADVNAEGKIIP